jgi:hypothetical protein
MAQQNINQYVYEKFKLNISLDNTDMSLSSDENDYQQEVIFSPYLIAQTFGNKLPIYYDTNSLLTNLQQPLSYKSYDVENIFVSQNYYNINNDNFCNFSSNTACDIGLTGIDNGLVNKMSGETINFTNGVYNDYLKFQRLFFDRRMKMFQVTGYTSENHRFSGISANTLYEVVSKHDDQAGYYHELYGGFYQGFYKLFGYDYDILPERMNKGWSVEMLLKPRFCDEYPILSGETTLNKIYPNNKNTFFYFGTRAENKFYHHADGSPNCFTGYTRVTSGLTCIDTCACCSPTFIVTTTTTAYPITTTTTTFDIITGETYQQNITNSRCIYVYPPRSENNIHDSHINYGCDQCNGNKNKQTSCGCGCGELPCDTCGWECQTHKCDLPKPTPTPTPSPTPSASCGVPTPICTPSCRTCTDCVDCVECVTTGITSIENTCEVDPLFDALSNALSFKLCGDPKNPKIGVRVLRITGECITTGTTITGQTFVTGYTVDNYCSPNGIYDLCAKENPAYLDIEKWFLINVVWERYISFNFCDLKYFGGLGDITNVEFLDSLAQNTTELIKPPITNGGKIAQTIELVRLNNRWLSDKKYRMGRLRIYINGKSFYTIEDFEEVIPRALNTDKEKQLGVPFNISWGGGTQGLHENLTFSSCSELFSNYIQDPENFPTELLKNTSLSGLTTHIILEQNFGGSFEGGVSQFRMYVEPLTASEVKHNFNILKNQFSLFDYDCPDCATLFCEPNDLTYVINELTTTTTTFYPITTTTTTGIGFGDVPFQLGREFKEDKRDKNYLITKNIQVIKEQTLRQAPKTLTSRYWSDTGWWGNQKSTPQCVGYSWAHWLEDGPVEQKGVAPIIKPSLIYQNAQKLDEWSGENYDGTSVRGGVKYLKSVGKVKSYYWAYDLNTLINTVMNIGPVVVGTNWYYNMFFPDKNGVIKIGGDLSGGHAYVINGVDTKTKMFRLKNSWGKSWGKSGSAFISFANMERLIKEQGEICLAIELS